jgi:uncharacterized protein with PIN domain
MLGKYDVSPYDLIPQSLKNYTEVYHHHKEVEKQMQEVVKRLDNYAISIDLDKCIKCTR